MNLLCKLEAGRLESELLAPLFQFLINRGHVWNLQNFHAAFAVSLIEEGVCVYGTKSIRSAYGGYFPSRFEIKEDEPGSLKYQSLRGYELILV